ncbi:hypothetical protein NMG60_11037133 [Bertholletia excelsa]
MSILSQCSSKWILLLKVVLVSTAVMCMATALKLSVPVMVEFASSEIPSIWSFVASWLRPPYLYVVINCIIISIVASSKLQQKFVNEAPFQPEFVKVSADYAVMYDGVAAKSAPLEARREFAYGYKANLVEDSKFVDYEQVDAGAMETEIKEMTSVIAAEEMNDQKEMAVARSLPSRQVNSMECSSYEKPPMSIRIGHRKAVKSSPEGGRTLRVSKPKRHETLENTWKTITEGRPMPLTRHLKKSDTWESRERVSQVEKHHDQRMAKSETFNIPATHCSEAPPPPPVKLRREPSGSAKIRREPSMGQDELNRRVEAFIRKFNEEMRLQRQESLNRYMEMIDREAR